MRPCLLALLLLAAPALAQEGAERERLLRVPHLTGAWTFDVGGETRFPSVLDEPEPSIPEEWLRLHVGYLHYLDGHGRVAWGGYLGGGFSLGSDQVPVPNDATRLDLGLALRLRSISHDFVHATVRVFAEVGVQFAEPVLGRVDDDLAVRFAGGLETGVGLLWLLDPYVFGETLFRVGVETIDYADQRYTAVFGGLRLQFDWALQTGPSAPMTHEEERSR